MLEVYIPVVINLAEFLSPEKEQKGNKLRRAWGPWSLHPTFSPDSFEL